MSEETASDDCCGGGDARAPGDDARGTAEDARATGDDARGTAEDARAAAEDRPEGVSSNPTNPFASGVSRRRVMEASAAAGAAASLAGCGADSGDGDGATPTVFVFNNGDRTVSVIDAETDELLDTVFVDTTASFPANQYGTTTDDEYGVLWLNVANGVRALDAASLEELEFVETGFGANYPNLTPDTNHLVVGAGGSLGIPPEGDADHRILRVDADPDSDSFGEITGDLSVGYTGPCDATVGPDGEYAFVPDVANDTISVVQIDPFEVVEKVDAGEPASGENVLPFMSTASFDGEVMLVENGEGSLGEDGGTAGSESIWDISDPTNPEETAKITRDDGLPGLPITSEISPDGSTGYLFTPAANGLVVVDIEAAEITTTIDVGGNTIGGTWGPNREKLYVPVQDQNEVAVVEGEEVTTRVDAGQNPTGATAGSVRPGDVGTAAQVQASLASLGLAVGEKMEWTYCPDGHCYCMR
ncbi:MAG: YncE family protein [Halobacteriales archaeon]